VTQLTNAVTLTADSRKEAITVETVNKEMVAGLNQDVTKTANARNPFTRNQETTDQSHVTKEMVSANLEIVLPSKHILLLITNKIYAV